MPQLDRHSHAILSTAGYRYCELSDKYFNDGNASWDVTEKIAQGKVQGAFPSSTIEEFREQEAAWIAEQKLKIKTLKHAKSAVEVVEEIPLSNWLGLSTAKSTDDHPTIPRSSGIFAAPSKRNLDLFVRRSDEEIRTVVAAWEAYVHPRAREFFPTHDMLINVLTQMAKSVHNLDDPVLGSDAACCHWFGEITKDEPQQACIRMVKPGESTESTTFVNRVLVFIFATDESFEQLMKLPKEPFRMTCSDQLCVNLNHISVD